MILIKNNIQIHNDYAEIVIKKKNGNMKKFKIDIEDIEKIEKYRWWDHSGYAITDIPKNSGKIMLHRYLMDVIHISHLEVIVDHINRDPTDNRKFNLRLVNPTQSSINRGVQSNNKSGISGVTWDKKANKWAVYIKYKYAHRLMGSSEDLEEATKIRLQAELDIFGME